MKDVFRSYYTDSEEITSYMVKKLQIKDDDLILEPSAGEGVFIDEILKQNKCLSIDALDINEEAILELKRKFQANPVVNIRHTDTLLDEELDLLESTNGYYDKVIGNPPYGAWQDYEKRDFLKKKYLNQYVKETYTLFLLRSISVLKAGGRLSFIIPDTFLFLNMHEKLRKIILKSTKIEEILIFPSKFFPGVSFGYSNLSIVTLQKCEKKEALNNIIRIYKGFKSVDEFEKIFQGVLPNHLKIFDLKQRDILLTDKSRFILSKNSIGLILEKVDKTLGDVADVVTGFYSGNNRKFVRSRNSKVRGAKNYQTVDEKKVMDSCLLSGIPDMPEAYIPYLKGSSSYRYKRLEDEWYVRWDEGTVKHYHLDKKARFQNSQFYFKKGVAIPMVKSSFIKATLMENKVFDQSVVGIFPKDEEDIYYILGLMNSDVINQLIHLINPTANNSANYVKKLPYIKPSLEEKIYVSKIVKKIIALDPKMNLNQINNLHEELDKYFKEIYFKEIR